MASIKTRLVNYFFKSIADVVTSIFFKFKVKNRKNVPEKGGVLLTPNHVSFFDGLFMMASLKRPIRFVMDATYYNKWFIRPFAQLLRAIPVSSSAGTKILLKGVRSVKQALQDGDTVCLFPEGEVSRTGKLLPFKRGIELMVKGSDCSIVPVYIDSECRGVFRGYKKPFFKNIEIIFGNVCSSDVGRSYLHKTIRDMEHKQCLLKRNQSLPIHHQFIKRVKRNPFLIAVADKERQLAGFKTLSGALIFAKLLEPFWKDQKNIGLLLPTCIASTVVNLATTLSGRVSVNLNFTSGRENIQSALRQAEIKTVITSRQFVEKASCELPENVDIVFLEDLAKNVTVSLRLSSLFIGLFSSISTIEKYCGCDRQIDIRDPLTIVFTSGSTGEPKGVVLTHFNLVSNIEAISYVLPDFGKTRNLLASLPYFHSFGFMLMWLGLNYKIGLITHPNPLEGKVIGALVKKYKIKLIMSTPTFLRGYIKQVEPDQFKSLQCVIAGSEKLPLKTAEAFEEAFGIRPIEGYGATECAPVIAASTLDISQAGIYQVGNVQGSVGQALPGVLVKAVDPETFQELKEGAEGLLLVKGPNIMEGYLHREDLTDEVMLDGWYVTGDIGIVDIDGFIRITDRLRRFSKIGGEMVPHGRVEEALHEAAELEEQAFAVTAIPDDKKGEKLAVLYTIDKEKLADIIKKLTEKGLSNLYIPRLDHFIHVDELPLLGSGKLDLQMMRQLALEYICKSNCMQNLNPSCV